MTTPGVPAVLSTERFDRIVADFNYKLGMGMERGDALELLRSHVALAAQLAEVERERDAERNNAATVRSNLTQSLAETATLLEQIAAKDATIAEKEKVIEWYKFGQFETPGAIGFENAKRQDTLKADLAAEHTRRVAAEASDNTNQARLVRQDKYWREQVDQARWDRRIAQGREVELRAIAERVLHYRAEITGEEWVKIYAALVTPGSDKAAAVLVAADRWDSPDTDGDGGYKKVERLQAAVRAWRGGEGGE